jgi:hypothetical protein
VLCEAPRADGPLDRRWWLFLRRGLPNRWGRRPIGPGGRQQPARGYLWPTWLRPRSLVNPLFRSFAIL